MRRNPGRSMGPGHLDGNKAAASLKLVQLHIAAQNDRVELNEMPRGGGQYVDRSRLRVGVLRFQMLRAVVIFSFKFRKMRVDLRRLTGVVAFV